MRRVLILGAALALACGCEEEQKPVETKVEMATPAPEAAKADEMKKAEGDMGAKEEAEGDDKAEGEAKGADDRAEGEDAKEADPLTECCRALGSAGFTKRSQEYMAASKECGTAMTEKKSLDQALAMIKKELKTEPLPDECSKK